MYSSGLYARAARPAPASTRAGAASAGCGSPPRPSGSRSCAARSSAATTYGLELDLLTPAETHDRLPLLAVDDVLAAGWLPGDGYLRARAAGRTRWPHGATALGVPFATGVRVTGIEVGRRPGDRRRHRPPGAIATEIVVDAAGAAAGHVGRLAGVVIPIVPIKPPVRGHRARSAPIHGGRPDGPRPRPRSSTSAGRGRTALLVGGYVARPGRRGTTPTRCGAAHPVRARPGRVRRVVGQRAAPGPGAARARDRPGRARPGGVHPRRRVPARRDRGRRASGSPPGSACTGSPRRGRRRQGDRRVDRRRHPGVRRVHDGHPALRCARREPQLGRDQGARRLLPLLRRRVPGPGVDRRPAAAPVAGLAPPGDPRRRPRREGRLGAGQLVRRQRLRRR